MYNQSNTPVVATPISAMKKTKIAKDILDNKTTSIAIPITSITAPTL